MMHDPKNIVNLCVKCESKFTSLEKPLKLLPCLHSMCLDCLYGRTPVRRNTSTEENASSGKKESGDAPADTNGKKNESHNKNSSRSNSPTAPDTDSKEQDKTDNSPTSKHSKENGVDAADVNKPNDQMNKETPNGVSGSDSDATKDAQAKSPVVHDKTETADTTGNKSHDATEKEPIQAPILPESENENKVPEPVIPKPVTECPVCRDPIDQPGLALMDNMFAALDPETAASPEGVSTHLCTGCEEGQQASSYCLQCEEWLCDSCVDAHKRVRITKDHTISPKDEVNVVTTKSPWEQYMTCKQHRQEQLKFFCEKCEKLTCRDCQLMDHKDHKYQFLDQAAEHYKARLKGSLALMGEKRSKLATSRDEIEQKLTNCKEQKDALQQDILRQADVLVKGIRQAVWGVLSNLASFTDAATKRLNKEIDDVSDLVGKFDHCIHFMEEILSEGSSMSLLYSKGSVEAKCRKVYHTQMDPQSLKGTLLIQYRHEVNWLLGNLNKIGAIFVNGVRYPPDKNGGQSSRHSSVNSSSGMYQEPRGGSVTATSPHLQHMANQPIPGQRGSEWSKFIQTVSKQGPVIPPNISLAVGGSSGSLPPQLTLPSNRRPQGGSGMVTQPWPGPPGLPPGSTFPGHFVAGQLLTPQQQQHSGQTRPSFTPMRLHHRPAAQHPSFPSQNAQTMRSPPQYRMGGEASGTSRSAHSTPDPARPASAGMYDSNGRPDSGGSAMMEVKKEKRERSPDCVITMSSLKADRQAHFQSAHLNTRPSETALEMQRNLDEVIRAVPMDLSENMEQISGTKQINEAPPPPPPPALKPAPPPVPPSPPALISSSPAEIQGPKSPTDEELRENWQGGNSMPGFSLPQGDSHCDPNDDYCACCHNGGDVLCCDNCPKVFHLQCHIPELVAVPSGSFKCTLCEGDNPVEPEEVSQSGKRKAPGGLTDAEVKVCERILLDLFCHPSSVPFQEPVNKVQVPNYYKIITQPMDFTQIKCKLQRRHHNHYQSIKAFLFDMRQVFINCAIYNKAGSEVGKAGKIVRSSFESLVERLMPQYLLFVKENPSPCYSALTDMNDPEVSSAATVENADVEDSGNEGPHSPKRLKVDQ